MHIYTSTRFLYLHVHIAYRFLELKPLSFATVCIHMQEVNIYITGIYLRSIINYAVKLGNKVNYQFNPVICISSSI